MVMVDGRGTCAQEVNGWWDGSKYSGAQLLSVLWLIRELLSSFSENMKLRTERVENDR